MNAVILLHEMKKAEYYGKDRIMINENDLARINELARKSKAEGLTEAELQEQKVLRARYIAAIRANLRSQLDNIDVVEADGTIENLGEKYGKKPIHDVLEKDFPDVPEEMEN